MGLLAKIAWRLAPETTAKAAKKLGRPRFVAPPNDGKIRLNLGSGDKNLRGYINVDIVEGRGGAKPDVQSDLRKLGFASGYADEIMSIHVIEHFYEWEVQDLLAEWKRVLKPGGTITLECPNLMYAVKRIAEDESLLLDTGKDGWGMTMFSLYGNPFERDPYMCHRWGWTPKTLAAELEKAGFVAAHEEKALFKKGNPRDMRIVATKPQA